MNDKDVLYMFFLIVQVKNEKHVSRKMKHRHPMSAVWRLLSYVCVLLFLENKAHCVSGR